MSDWNFRLAEPADAAAFADWAARNTNIDPTDLRAGLMKTNPTVLTFVAEKDGVAVAFAPVYLSAVLAHLAFNPEVQGMDRLRALNVLRDGVAAFMVQYGIREILTLSEPQYPVAQWALRHGFEADPRVLFKLDVNQEMVEAH